MSVVGMTTTSCSSGVVVLLKPVKPGPVTVSDAVRSIDVVYVVVRAFWTILELLAASSGVDGVGELDMPRLSKVTKSLFSGTVADPSCPASLQLWPSPPPSQTRRAAPREIPSIDVVPAAAAAIKAVLRIVRTVPLSSRTKESLQPASAGKRGRRTARPLLPARI